MTPEPQESESGERETDAKEVPFPSTEIDGRRLRKMEGLLANIEGVAAVTVVPDERGGLEEIHILSSSEFNPKQIVRNVESALRAELGVKIDHRIISIAQTKDELPAGNDSHDDAVKTESDGARLQLAGLRIERQAGHNVTCKVELTGSDESYSGTATASDHPDDRVEAAGRAVFTALTEATGDDAKLTFRGIEKTEAFGGEVVLAMAYGLIGRSKIELTGVASVEDSPEEAAVLAVLHATNRWVGRNM